MLYLQSDENEDDNIDSQNNDHDSSDQKNKLNMQCKGNASKYLFNLTLVNSYGSTDIQALQDNGKPLKLTGIKFELFISIGFIVFEDKD